MARKRLLGETTTLVITKETRDRLASLGTKDQTFDQIISELLKKWNGEN
jgi:hypothetical protein